MGFVCAAGALAFAERATDRVVVRDGLCHKVPELPRMVEFQKVAELVDHDVVRHFGGQKRNLPVEIKLSVLGTAPPPALLISDGNGDEFRSVELIKMCESFRDERTRRALVRAVLLPCPARKILLGRGADPLEPRDDPARLLRNEPVREAFMGGAGQGYRHLPVPVDGDRHPLRASIHPKGVLQAVRGANRDRAGH